MCDEVGSMCIYMRAPPRREPLEGSARLENLEKRMKVVEGFMAAQTTLETNQPQQGVTLPGPSWSGASTNSPDAAFNGKPAEATSFIPAEANSLASAVDPIDGMGAVAEQEENSVFHGPSSNIPLSRSILQMMARANNLREPWDSSLYRGNKPSTFVNTMSSPDGNNGLYQNTSSQDRYMVPPETVSDELIRQYFSNVDTLFPYIHQASFLEAYDEMKRNGPRHTRTIWLGLFNIILAVATNMIDRSDSSTPNQSMDEAQTFYRRAISLCDRYVLGGSSLEVVQYLLAMTMYLQATQKSVQTSVVHGLAVNAAIRTGMHSVQASHKFSPLEREMRKRAWYMCMIFDRVISMTLGQPIAIPNENLIIELPTQLDYYSHHDGRPGDSGELSLGLFNAAIGLYKITGTIIDQLYGKNLGLDKSPSVIDIISPIAGIDNDLRDWADSLSPNLKPLSSAELLAILAAVDSPGAAFPRVNRCRVVLTLRSLNVRVLLYRPVLARYIDTAYSTVVDPAEALLLNRLGSYSLQICFRSAMEIITIVSTLVQTRGTARQWLNAWWFTLYYTFNAALVVFGVMLVRQDPRADSNARDAPSKEQCMEGLERAVKALERLDVGNKIIERCHNYLQRLIIATNPLLAYPNDSARHGNNDLALMSGNGNSNERTVSSDLMALPPQQSSDFLQAPLMLDNNVANLITGEDLEFLDFYFAPPNDLSSTFLESM
ncbi:hypothetical protein H2200_012810 [Cladophialophora chaetospira]|uniref:Xylanolytic transcriptional activator regulatory domain-containing protein n=1 Tax=Cladophialophora chaetospira TaxID=386627 RepID=A0AA39CBX0_9EURO|nr:hypothetical protein H2200_012810 [Cladophialophora chaetospira]